MRNSSYLATKQAVHLHGEAWQRTSFNRRGAFRTEEHSLQAIVVVVVYSGPKCYWSCRNETTIIISHIPTFHPVLHTEFTTAAPRQLPNSLWPSRIKEYNQIILFRFCPNIYIEAGQESRRALHRNLLHACPTWVMMMYPSSHCSERHI